MPDCTGRSDFALFNFTLTFPCRGAVGGDDAFAAFESFGDDETEVLGKGRKDENVTPLPNFLEFFAKGIGDDAQLDSALAFHSIFKIHKSLQGVTAAEIEKVEVFFDRINGIYRIKIAEFKEPFDVGEFDWWTPLAKIRLNPLLLRLASGYNRLATAEAESLNRTCKPLLPTLIPQPHRIIARLRHPMNIAPPQRRPPKTGKPTTVNPHFICRPQLAHLRPRRIRHFVPFAALLVHDHPGDVRRAVPLLPSSTDMNDSRMPIPLFY